MGVLMVTWLSDRASAVGRAPPSGLADVPSPIAPLTGAGVLLSGSNDGTGLVQLPERVWGATAQLPGQLVASLMGESLSWQA